MRNKFLKLTAISSLAVFGFSSNALAFDEQDFAKKLSASISLLASTNVTFENVVKKGKTITLSGMSIPANTNEIAKSILDNSITFYGIKETKNGAYTAKSAEFENIDFTYNDINVKIDDIEIKDILISADPVNNVVENLLLYRKMSTGEISVSVGDKEAFKIDSILFANVPNKDKSEFTSEYEVNGIYGDLSLIPEEEARLALASVGLTTIEGRMDGDFFWSVDDGRAIANEMSIDLKNIGKLDITLDFLGYTLDMIKSLQVMNQDLITLDPASPEHEAKSMEMAMSMVSKMSLNEVAINFDDDGITNKILDMVAAQQGTNKEEMIVGLAMMASIFSAELKMPQLQEQIKTAITTYLNDPKTIEIKANPSEAVPLMTFMALAPNPPALIAALNLSILANQ